jgi:hypothetical protein
MKGVTFMKTNRFFALLLGTCTASALIGVLFGYYVFGSIVVSTDSAIYNEALSEIAEDANQTASAQGYTENENESDTDEPVFVVTSKDGYIVVYFADEISEVTFTPVHSLPQEEQERLARGISVYTEDDLFRILEDYGS